MELVILGLAFVVAITIHEFAHAFTADRLGDPTPRIQGRLTLNPLAHIDTIGTIIVPLFLIITRSPIIFGWAKPVRFDPYNLKDPRRDAAIISFAGPASNIVIALLSSLALRLLFLTSGLSAFVTDFLVILVFINIILAVFNLIPVHPLDGGKILIGLLPTDIAHQWDAILRQYGLLILLLLIFPIFGGRSLLFTLIGPTIELLTGLLLPGSASFF